MTQDQILKVAEKVRAHYLSLGSLKGMCLDASNAICEKLERKGATCAIQFGNYLGQKHAWVNVWMPDGLYALDVTADQFGTDIPGLIWGKQRELPEFGWDPEEDEETTFDQGSDCDTDSEIWAALLATQEV